VKKIFILLQAIAIHFAIFPQSNYNLKFNQEEFSFLETEMGVQILCESTSYYFLEDATLPALPYKAIYILIPENTDIKNVSISIKSEEIRQDIYLMKNPVAVPVSENSNNSHSYLGNYSKDTYPDKNLNFKTVAKLQGFYMAAFTVSPFIYHAHKQTLELITEMDISFDQTTAKPNYSGVRRYDMEEVIRSLVINPDEVDTLYPQIKTLPARSTTHDVEYLIITSEDLKESFAPLKAWKTRKGVKTEIITTEYIYSNYAGNTDKIKIKRCLEDYYENRNLKWALLGGDNIVVPVQMCYVRNQSGSRTDFTPCDLFYACFDGAFDWDANGNGIIGEVDDNVDLIPEIYISRLPVRDSDQVTAFVNKLLKYETNPATSNYVKKMLLAGVHIDNTWGGQSDAHRRSEYMYEQYIAPFWNGVKYRFYDTGTDFPYDLTSSNLQTQLGNGYHFFHMASHGSINTWTISAGDGYSASDASALQNENASIILTIACHTNAFDNDTILCLSEAFIQNPMGAGVAYWGSSRYGWNYSLPTLNFGSSLRCNAEFYFRLFNSVPNSDSYKFAAITSATKQHFFTESVGYGTMRWLQFSLNAIGCAEMPIYTEDPLQFTNVVISQNGSSITVNANTAGCTIAISSIDDGQSYFEVVKNVSSHTFTNVDVPSYITITKHNYIPYLGDFCTPSNMGVQENISQNTTWSIPRRVTGAVTIQSGATLTITSTVKCDDVASFTIQPGGKLIIDGGKLTNTCAGEMWQGVTVLGDPTKPLTQSNQGYVELKNGGKIENAIGGITVHNGGMVDATNAYFVNNTVGVSFEPLALGQSGRSGTFTLTNFILNDNYFGNTEDFEAHIKMKSSGSVLVKGCTFSSTAPYINGSNLGIEAFNTSLTVEQHCPGVAASDGSCPNSTISHFTGFYRAISAYNSGASPILRIRYSSFDNNMHGLSIDGINNHELIRNNFHLSQSHSYGMYISNATGFKIEENSFTNTHPATNTRTIGLTIRNSGIAENEVYKNTFTGLYVAQQFLCSNSSLPLIPGMQTTGLQTLCNTFNNSQYKDILVGGFPGERILCLGHHLIKENQGNLKRSAGNLFNGNPVINISNIQALQTINYYYGNSTNQLPTFDAHVYPYLASSNSCPSRIGVIGGGGDLDRALSQYDEWNQEYENRLTELLAFEDDNEEEYNELLQTVSYYSALKDNHFNSIIIAMMNEKEEEEAPSGMMFTLGGEWPALNSSDSEMGTGMQGIVTLTHNSVETSPSNLEGVPEGRGSLYRLLLTYRGSYTDYLSIVETYLKENNYRKAMTTLIGMYERFEITAEQTIELNDLGIYIHWLLRLEEDENNIYALSSNELGYLINYVETHTGRGTVFAKNIICELYEICIEDEEEAANGIMFAISGDNENEVENGMQGITGLTHNSGETSPSRFEGVPKGRGSLYENITLHPNPTTGELTITITNQTHNNGELRIENIEIFDVFGKKLSSHHSSPLALHSSLLINISHLNPGIYFVKITTDAGEVVKKIVKQ